MTDTTRDAFEALYSQSGIDHLIWDAEVNTYKGIAAELWKFYQAATLKATADIDELRQDLQFVERWANHHGTKPHMTAEQALGCIQHYPPILEITRSYTDGKVPDTRNPWAELEAATEQGKRQPLTDEQIASKWRAAYLSSKAFTTLETYTYFAREIEALHGITPPQGKILAPCPQPATHNPDHPSSD